MEKINFTLTSYFLNKKLFLSTGDDLNQKNLKDYFLQIAGLDKNTQDLLIKGKFETEIVDFISRYKINSLEELLLDGNIKEGQLVIFNGALYFRGLNRAIEKMERGEKTFALFHRKFPEFNNILFEGNFSSEHLTCNTATAELTRYNRKFIFGYIKKVENLKINVRPIIIADRLLDSPQNPYIEYRNNFKIMPERIDEFKYILARDHKYFDVKELANYPEKQIKKWFAEIINEGNIPKDWGGESSDLFSSHIHYEGRRYYAAFLFKGPSCFHKMTLKDLGKNGDQIVRLFNEPADILVLQHCHYIRSEVIKTMEAFASRFYSPKYYCVVDGIDTLRILKGYMINKIRTILNKIIRENRS